MVVFVELYNKSLNTFKNIFFVPMYFTTKSTTKTIHYNHSNGVMKLNYQLLSLLIPNSYIPLN